MPEYASLLFFCFVAILTAPFAALYFLLQRRDRKTAKDRTTLRKELDNEKKLRKTAEDKIRIKTEWFRNMIDSTSDMVLVHGITDEGLPGTFIDANRTVCLKLAYAHDKILTLSPFDIEEQTSPTSVMGYVKTELATLSDGKIREHQHLFARNLMTQIREKKEIIYERVFVTSHGDKIPVEVKACCFEQDEVPIIVCTARDISERKATEEALEDSEHRFHDFFAHSPIGVARYDSEKTLSDVNPAALKLLGIPDQQEFAKFDPFDNPFMPDSVRKAIAQGETARYEASIDFVEAAEQSLFISSRRGHGYYDVVINTLGHDKAYKVKGYLVQIVDVTKRRETEQALRQIERQLHQAQKMEAIGTLAGGIAHDFNNILTPIIGYAEMALHTVPEEEALHQYMKEVVKASHRAKDLVNQILAFSRQTEPEGKPIRITPIVKEVAKLQKAAFPANIEFDVIIKTQNDVVVVDPTQIHQVVMNLCTNAAHAIGRPGGRIEVRMMDFLHIDRPGSEFPDLAPGRYLRLSIKDSGSGMDAKTRARIFEPFFTTKERGEGTGMGLAVVHGIITSLKGTIVVDSELNQGTTFHVVIPVVDEEELDVTETTESLPIGSGQILFVDDDKEILKMAEQMLSNLGYKTIIAHQATAALRLFQLEPHHYDLVITDMVMPGMDGKELAVELQKIRSDIPIVLCTGFSEIPTDEEMALLGVCGLIMKPIVMRDMAVKLQQALGHEE